MQSSHGILGLKLPHATLALALGALLLLAALPARADHGPEHARNGMGAWNASTTGTIHRGDHPTSGTTHGDDDDTSGTLGGDDGTSDCQHLRGPIRGEHHGNGNDNLSSLTQQQRFEVLWLLDNIRLHKVMLQITGAELAQTTSTEIKTFATDLQTSLGQELTQMQGFLLSWYNIDATSTTLCPPDDDDPMMMTKGDPDLRFLLRVISYERSEIGAGKLAVKFALHPELAALGASLALEGKNVITLVEAWADLLIQLDQGNKFHEGGDDGDDDGAGGSHGGSSGHGGGD